MPQKQKTHSLGQQVIYERDRDIDKSIKESNGLFTAILVIGLLIWGFTALQSEAKPAGQISSGVYEVVQHESK